jgi:stage V sporulation protein G
MEITQVRVFPVTEDKLKAFVSIIIDDCFVVSDIKIIQGSNGLFISMPSKKRKNGSFRDIAHPLNNETRRRIEEEIIREYREVVGQVGADAAARLRELADVDVDDEVDPQPRAPEVRRSFDRRAVFPPMDRPGG